MKGNVAAIALIVFGTFFLLTNLGLINVSLADLFKTWWPAILVALGIRWLVWPRKSCRYSRNTQQVQP